jgi:uncharacterized membrane protein YdjX (TVP38/TMEM64 family)
MIWNEVRRVGPAGPITLLSAVLPGLGALATFALGPVIAPWLREHGAFGMVVFVVAVTVLGGLALVPTFANSFIAGWTYKFALGFPTVMIGLLGAAMVTYLLARRLSGHRVEALIAAHPKWEIVRQALVEKSFWRTVWVVVLIRLSPILPYETTSVLLAVTGVEVRAFALGTVLGIAPRTAVVVLAASRAARLDFHQTHNWWYLAFGLAATVLAVAVIGVIAKHALQRAFGTPI